MQAFKVSNANWSQVLNMMSQTWPNKKSIDEVSLIKFNILIQT